MSVQNGYLLAPRTQMPSHASLSIQKPVSASHQPSSSSQSLSTLVSPLANHGHLQIGPSVPLNGLGAAGKAPNVNGAPETSDSAPVKRGPGRPKGSTNKNKPPLIGMDGNPLPKRPVGRPRKEIDPNAPVKPKNPVGRPRKQPQPTSANPTVLLRPTELPSQPATSAVATPATAPTANRSSVSTNELAANHVRTHESGNPPGSLMPPYNQQMPASAGSSRLVPSPTSTPAHRQWSAVEPMAMYRNPANGHTQLQQSTQAAPLHHPNNASTSSGPQFQYHRYNNPPDQLAPSAAHSPVVEPHRLATPLNTSSPSAPPTHLHAPHNHRPVPAPQPVPPQTPVTPVNAPPRNHASTVPPRQSMSRAVAPHWEQVEANIWKEIQKLNIANPRVTITSARTRTTEYTALKRSVSSSVLSGYSDHLKELRRQTPADCPDTYTILNSFWLPGVSPYFQLTTSRQAYSSTLSNHRFFYWDPMYLLVGGIPCPICSSRLTRDGFHGPCPVLNVGDPFYLIGQVYKCSSCDRRQDISAGLFLSWDERILTSLPERLAREFPAHIKSWGAVSNSLHELVQASAKAGMDPKQVCEIIRTVCKVDTPSLMDPAAMQELPPSPITAPSSPELPERQRIYYRAWHRNGRLPDSLAPSGGSPPLPESSRDPDEIEEDILGTLQEGNIDTRLEGPNMYNGTSKTSVDTQLTSTAVDKSPRSSSTGTPGKTATQKKSTNVTSVPPGGMAPMFYPVPFFPSGSRNVPFAMFPGSPENLRRPNPYSDGDSSPNKKRRVRHCAKCGSETCKGRGGGSNCPHPCRDCHKTDCKGRSSAKPGRPCDNTTQQTVD